MKAGRREFLKSVIGAVTGIVVGSLLPPVAKKFGKPIILPPGFKVTPLFVDAGVTGGYIVPPQFMNELLEIVAEENFIGAVYKMDTWTRLNFLEAAV